MEELARLSAAIDALDTAQADPETLIAIVRVLTRLEAKVALSVAAVERAGAWRAEGGRP
jgi:hypothetical protein